MTWLTSAEAAEHLRMHPDEVRRRARAGDLPGYQRSQGGAWRFDLADLDAYARGELAAAIPTRRRRARRAA